MSLPQSNLETLMSAHSAATTSSQLFAQIKTVGEEYNIHLISENAVQPILNVSDQELTLALARAALTIASKDGLKTLMLKHSVAAYSFYNLVCDEMAIKAPKLTKKGMRDRAIADSKTVLTKVSPAAIDLIYDKDDQQIAHVRWSLAIQLASSTVMKETKTLQKVHAETAIEILDHLKTAIDIVCREEEEQIEEQVEDEEEEPVAEE